MCQIMYFSGFAFQWYTRGVRPTHDPNFPPHHDQQQTLVSPDGVRTNGAIVLEEHFYLCDVKAGSSGSEFDVSKSSLVICDIERGPISFSALCCPTPHYCWNSAIKRW